MKKPIPFGKYLLIDRINVGGMAEVFKAKAFGVEGFERFVAVKRILPNISEDQEFVSMFVDEAKIVVQLNHNNIGQVFDLGKVDGSYYIAMEYISGKDLRSIFNYAKAQNKTLSIPLTCFVIMKISEALDYAHSKKSPTGEPLNLIHRDVSPQNCLISYDGDTKLIDFGIAKVANKVNKTQAGILKGKFGYMSPEQVRGLPIDHRSDIFSTGVVLYELLTGQRLFIGNSDFSTLEKVRKCEFPPPRERNAQIPPDLEAIVLRALARDPDQRYQSAMDLHDDLQSFMYTQGFFFARKNLTEFMKQSFAEDIAKEHARDQQLQEYEEDYGSEEAPLELVSSEDGLIIEEEQTNPTQPAGEVDTQPNYPSEEDDTPQHGAQIIDASGSEEEPVIEPVELEMDWDEEEELATQLYDDENMLPMDVSPSHDVGPVIQPLRLDDDSSDSASEDSVTRTVTTTSRARMKSPAFVGIVSALAALLFVGLVGGLWALLSDDKPGTIHFATVPSDPEVRIDGRAVSATSSPFLITQVEAGVDHRIEVKKDGYRTWSTEVHLSEDQRLELPLVALEKIDPSASEGVPSLVDSQNAKVGALSIVTIPNGAEVFINGQKAEGTTPMNLEGLSVGELKVRITKGEIFEPWTGSVKIAEGEQAAALEVKLKQVKVKLQVESTPKLARVVLKKGSFQRELGQTPLTALIDLRDQGANIEVTMEGFKPWKKKLSLNSEETKVSMRAELVSSESQTLGQKVTSKKTSSSQNKNTKSSDSNSGSSKRDSKQTASAKKASSRSKEKKRVGRSKSSKSSSSDKAATSSKNNVAANTKTVSNEPGKLRINTRPWSKVTIDGKSYGNTPQMNIALKPGRHRVTLENPEFNIRQTITVKIEPGKTVTKVIKLTPGK